MKKNENYLLLILKGCAMGAADVVPGVSGGTIAFITGIYEKLINSNSILIALIFFSIFIFYRVDINPEFSPLALQFDFIAIAIIV